MSSVLTILTDALKKIGVVSTAETLSSEESSDGLRTLNALLSSWNNDSLIVNGNQIEEFVLTPMQSVYTFGTGGDFNSSAPVRIEQAFLKYTDGTEYPVKLIDNEQWGRLTTKTTQSTLPTHVYIDENYPLRTVHVYPVPSIATTLVLHSFRKFSAFTSLTTEVQLAEGMERALVYNLALEFAPDYGKNPSGLVIQTAAESLALIQRNHNNAGILRCDAALVGKGSFDWRLGE